MNFLDKPSVQELITLLRTDGPLQRNDIAKKMKVQPSTVTRIVNQLMEHGLVDEVDPPEERKKKRGFPSKPLVLRDKGLLSAGVFIDPDRCQTCIIDSHGEIQSEQSFDIVDGSFDAVMGQAGELIKAQANRLNVSSQSIVGCGISYPGQHSSQVGTTFSNVPYMKDWPKFDASVELKKFFDVPVHHLNDAKAACLAEMLFGNSSRLQDFCYIWLTYGIGGAAVINRNLHLGTRGLVAEYGRLFPKSEPRPSGQDLLQFLKQRGHSFSRLDEIPADFYASGCVDEWVDRVEDQLRYLCMVLASTFAPQAIVLGGLLPRSVFQELYSRMKGEVIPLERFELFETKLLLAEADDKPHVGAAAIPLYYSTMEKISKRSILKP